MNPTAPSPSKQQLVQAKLFAEAARRVARPFDAFPEGDVAEVLLVLWQKAARLSYSAALEPSSPLMGELAREAMLRAAGSPAQLAAIESLLAHSAQDSGIGMSASAEALANFTRRLIVELERPDRDAARQRWRRARRYAALGVGLLGVAALVYFAFLRPPNLVKSAVRTLSSQAGPCENGGCGTATFHTKEERDPWVRYDFGSPKQLHSIAIVNRTDCCYDRAVPLTIETSDDGVHWTTQEVVEKPFVSWSGKLNVRARYVRLHAVGRVVYLHLREVVIR